MAGCKCKNGGKVRNPGCGCGGKAANPRKRRNPARLLTRMQLEQLVNEAQAQFPADDHLTLAEWMRYLDNEDVIEKVGDKYRLSREITQQDVRDALYAAGGHHLYSNPRKRRNPVHAASEDYKLGLIQGALERGKLPPPSSSSADLKRGYTDGHKVAKAMPAARSEALGVLKATGSHLKAGESLYEAAKGSKNATLSQNPRSSVANVLAGIARKHLDFDTLDTRRMGSLDFREVAVWSVKSALEDAYRAGSGGREPPTSLIAGLARKHLDFETLATRRMDSLDFREVAVWSVKSALEEAYRAGQRAAKSGQATVRNPRTPRSVLGDLKFALNTLKAGAPDWAAATLDRAALMARQDPKFSHLAPEIKAAARTARSMHPRKADHDVEVLIRKASSRGNASSDKRRNPVPKDHLKRGATRFGSAERLLKKGDYFDAIVEASQAKSDFFDGIEADRKDALDGIVFASDLARKAFKSSKGQIAGMPFRNPRKHRNPKEVTGQDVHDAYYRLYQALPAHTDEVTLRALARELGVSPDSVPFTGSSLYTVGGRVYPMLSKEDLLILRQGPTAKANPRKHRNPMSAAARKHLAHEKSEERSFASLMSKMPQGETVMLGKHRVRKLGKGYVVVDGVRLTTTQAAAKIHRGK